MTYPEPTRPDQPYPTAPGAPGDYASAPPSPPPPKRTAVVALAIVALLMLGAAAAFGALWYLERDDHDQTSQQLSTRDAQLADEKKAHDATKSELSAAEKARTDAESKVTELTPCSDAGKELARLALAQASEEEATQAGATLVVACGR